MSTDTTAEVVVEIPANLALVVKSTGLDTQAAEVIEASFAPLFVQANKWAAQVAGLKVTDVSQVREMKLARESRLALKEIRVLAGKNKDRLKEDSLKRSRAVDSIYNTVKGICEPLEAELLAQEQFALRAESARLATIKAERVASLTQYGVDCAFYQLDVMPAEQFAQLLAGSKAAHEAKIEAARKAEEARLAKIAEEAAERERIRVENERLKAEAKAAEEAAAVDRARAAAEKAASDLKAKQEREELELAMRKQQAEADAKAKAADKKAAAEREELRRQAQAALDAQAKAEAEAKAIRDAEAAKAAAEEAARRKAAAAPDREKVLAFAEFIRAIPAPVLDTADGKAAAVEIVEQIKKFAAWLEKKGGAL